MIERARRLLGALAPRVHYPPSERPSLIVHRKGDQWGVVMFKGTLEVAWWTPPEARRYARDLVRLANLAADPGQLPREDLG